MNPIVQNLTAEVGTSITAVMLETPLWETPWHQHEEIELCVVVKGSGKVFIGNYMGDYQENDVFLIGSNLPHLFRKDADESIGSAIVVHFKRQLFESLLTLPEMSSVRKITDAADQGFQLTGKLQHEIGRALTTLLDQSPVSKMLTLLACLDQIENSGQKTVLSKYYFQNLRLSGDDKSRIAYEFALENFRENISLDFMAKMTHQSVSSFCKKFKSSTKKSFARFLNEVRIGHACKLLKETNRSVTQICFDSGFRNWSNFSNQFRAMKGVPPSKYRQNFEC